MKTVLSFLCLLLLFVSCKQRVEKPDDLIEEEQMVNIIYDLTLLDGIKASEPAQFQSFNQNNFVYQKYNIDSLQFVKSNQYYASDMHKYKDIYNKVSQMILSDKERIDKIIKETKKDTVPVIVGEGTVQ